MRFLPAGPHAVLVEVDDLDEVVALQSEVRRRHDAGWAPSLVDVVPGARTLLLDGLDRASAARDLPSWSLPAKTLDVGPVIEIGCTYDGPDLPDVATQWRLSVTEVVATHTGILHTVAFCGFGPGFAYLSGIGEERSVARRPSPRASVASGSVALGGPYTGIYPRPSPGGWQLIGHTDAVVWDASRRPAALLEPGRRVRFVALGP